MFNIIIIITTFNCATIAYNNKKMPKSNNKKMPKSNNKNTPNNIKSILTNDDMMTIYGCSILVEDYVKISTNNDLSIDLMMTVNEEFSCDDIKDIYIIKK